MKSILRTSVLSVVLVVVGPVVVAILLQFYLFTGISPPPFDYGKGTMFDQIAIRYDMINRILAVGMDIGWRQQMVNKIHESILPLLSSSTANDETSSSDQLYVPQILDVATGTADVAILLAKSIPNVRVTGIDPSTNMLHIGRQKIQQQGLDNVIQLQLQDAQDLRDLQDSMFDGATMSFGIRNVPNRALALCHIHRVLKHNARFCILEFSEPDVTSSGNIIMGYGARFFIRYIVPVVGGILSGKPREYWHLQSSIQDFPSPVEFGNFLQTLNCRGLTTQQKSDDEHGDGNNGNDDGAADIGGGGGGAFHLEELIQLNFGSVQLYVTTAIHR